MADPLTPVPAAAPAPASTAPVSSPEPSSDALPVVTAEQAAVAEGDFSALQNATRARKQGKPLPDVGEATPKPPVAKLGPQSPIPSNVKRRVSQDEINEQIRKGVEAELARRTGQPAAPPRAAAPLPPLPPSAPPPATAADWKRYASMADAPKLADFDNLEEHTAAMALFVADKRFEERERDTSERQRAQRDLQALHQEAQQYADRMRKAFEQDPDLEILVQSSEEAARTAKAAGVPLKDVRAALAAKPISAMSPQERQSASFANIVAEAIFRSEQPGTLARHLADHPEEADRIVSLPSSQWLLALSRLDGRLETPAQLTRLSAPPRVSSAPAPPTTLGRKPATPADPKRAALEANDFGAYRQALHKDRQARRVS